MEKALPRTDEDQIKSQANLKRSLEIRLLFMIKKFCLVKKIEKNIWSVVTHTHNTKHEFD